MLFKADQRCSEEVYQLGFHSAIAEYLLGAIDEYSLGAIFEYSLSEIVKDSLGAIGEYCQVLIEHKKSLCFYQINIGTSGRSVSPNDRQVFNSRRLGEVRLDTARTGIGGGRRSIRM